MRYATNDNVLRIGALVIILLVWEIAVKLTGTRAFVLPSPSAIVTAFADRPGYFLFNAGITASEILIGLLVGSLFGMATALTLSLSDTMNRLAGPLLAASQALPVFAIAPLLVIWLGFGMASKIAMASLIIYFPVATAFADGLRRTDPGFLALARLNDASRFKTLWIIRLQAARPALGSGLRVAAGIAPIGAVVGEWVGASAGLGYIMLHANARMQTANVFVALVLLALMAIILRAATDWLVDHRLDWSLHDKPSTIDAK